MKLLNTIVKNRRFVHLALGTLLVLSIAKHWVTLGIVIVIGMISSVFFGKVFCRWICPMGFIMELMMGGDEKNRNLQLYNYHKMGCPIAWVGGFFNKSSFFKIRKDASTCTNCGICDDKCYIAKLNPEMSVHDEQKKAASDSFSCSKCLSCVEGCPSGSLKYTNKNL